MNVIEMRGIDKSFGSFAANKNVDFCLLKGEIHALLGENGAGKTTLMNILYGLLRPDAGSISVQGKPVEINSSAAAIAHSIGMVHQHFMLIPQLTVTQNIYMGMKETGFVLKTRQLQKNVREMNDRFGFNVDPQSVIWQLPIGVQQKVEILKVLMRDAKVLIFDEPTAVLTVQEVDELFTSLKKMAQEGFSIILITHKMKEVMEHCDRVTVMRAGEVVGVANVREISENVLAEMMVGRQVDLNRNVAHMDPGRMLLEVRDLSVNHEMGYRAVKRANLCLHANEIVGITGVDGNGQLELGEAIAGLREVAEGEILFEGLAPKKHTPAAMMRCGLGHIPDDRQKKGLVMDFSVQDNLMLGHQRKKEYVKGFVTNRTAVKENALALCKEYDIRCRDTAQRARSLSGGNQQKVILARTLYFDPKIVLAIQPTRGLDIGAIEFVRKKLVEERSKGKAVLLVSTDLDEVRTLCDRIYVMYDGFLSESVPHDIPLNKLGCMMAGSSYTEPEAPCESTG